MSTWMLAAVPREDRVRVDILVFDGMEELDAIAPYEVLACAAHAGAALNPLLVAVDGPGCVTARYGTTITVTDWWDPELADIVVIPGGGYANRAQRGTWAEIQRGIIPAALREAAGLGTVLASVCSGTMLLSAAGLTKGRPCTTHRSARADLIAAGARWVDARVVDDGDLITSGGVTSGLDLALWLLEREIDPQAALGVEQFLEYERRGTVWRSGTRAGA
jgi:transcriptional regulator GlxA family with amidase domain